MLEGIFGNKTAEKILLHIFHYQNVKSYLRHAGVLVEKENLFCDRAPMGNCNRRRSLEIRCMALG